MTDPPNYVTPGEISPPVKLVDLDRSTVVNWAQRHADNPNGRWVQIAFPEARTSNRYKVIGQLQDGSWIAVFWGQGEGSPGNRNAKGQIGNKGGRPKGAKNSKPRSDKGKKRKAEDDRQSFSLLLTPFMI